MMKRSPTKRLSDELTSEQQQLCNAASTTRKHAWPALDESQAVVEAVAGSNSEEMEL
jgi:hypothetical protein